LRHCTHCQVEREQVQSGMAIIKHLPLVEAPEALWFSIEAALQESRPRPAPFRWRWAFAAAAVLALAVASGVFWRVTHPAGTRWEVVRLDEIGGVRGVGRAGAGEWIETDTSSRARVKVGEIGSVEVAPNSRVRVVTARPGEHRLALQSGEIRAKITAPPRLFFVDTASGTAVDLGCEYKLTSDEDGSGLLQVTKGWVAFESKGLESLVPAGASCQTRPKLGPGIPYFDDAPERLKQALETGALSVVLSESRVRDTLTLWHLLSRVDAADRGRVFDRIAALTPVPAGVSREQALKLDPETLRRWKEELAWTW
jgi:hypothetical protein